MPVEKYVTDDGMVFSVRVEGKNAKRYTAWAATGAGPKQFYVTKAKLKTFRKLNSKKVNPSSFHSMLSATEKKIGKKTKTKR